MQQNFFGNNLNLSSLSERIKIARTRSGFSQEQLSQRAGVSKRTVERLENGESIQLSNFLSILSALGPLQNLDALIPTAQPTPMEYVLHRNERPIRLRVRSSNKKENPPFKWGDEE